MSLTRSAPRRLLLPVTCLCALSALAAFVSLNRDAQALAEAAIMLRRLVAKYGIGPGHLISSALRLLLTAVYPAVVLLAAWRAGGAVAGWLRLDARRRPGESMAARTALGAGMVALAMLGQAVTGLLWPPLPLVILCGMIALGAGPGPRARAVRRTPVPAAAWIPAALAVAAFLWDLPGAFGPEWFEDGQTYHLGLPERFLLTGRMPMLTGHLLGFLPLNAEMAYLAVMGLVPADGGNGIIREESARLLNWALGGLAAAMVGLLAARLARGTDGRVAGATAAWLFVSMPVTMVENEICLTDNWRVVMETAAMLLVLRGGAAPLAAAAACAGFAMGGKYLAVIRAVLLVAVIAASRRRTRVLRAAGFAAVASLVLLPWLSRNWLGSGDPVFPFLPGVFRPLGFDRPLLDRWMEDNRHYGVATMTLRSWASLPVRCALIPGDTDFGTFTTGPMLLGLSPLLFAGPWTAPAVAVALVAGAEGLVWSVTSHLIRYLLPALGLVCALLGCRIALVLARSPGWGAVLVGLAGIWAVPSGIMRVHHRINLDDGYLTLGAALGRGSAESVLAARGYGEAADRLGAGAVLLVGEDRVLGLGRRWIAASRYDRSMIKRWAMESRDARRFDRKVRQAGVGAVILNGVQFRAWLGRGPAFDLTERELRVINPWWTRLRVIWRRPPWEGSVPGLEDQRMFGRVQSRR